MFDQGQKLMYFLKIILKFFILVNASVKMAEGQKTPLFYHLAFEVISLQFTAFIDGNNLAASVED